MANATKRIPVTEERWEKLNELKGAGETYDDLLAILIQEHQRRELAERAYRTERPDHERVLDDLETVVEAT